MFRVCDFPSRAYYLARTVVLDHEVRLWFSFQGGDVHDQQARTHQLVTNTKQSDVSSCTRSIGSTVLQRAGRPTVAYHDADSTSLASARGSGISANPSYLQINARTVRHMICEL
jgi:hypothetical protein